MVLYVDLVFLLNFALNFIFIWIIETLFKDKINFTKIIVASLFGAVLIVSYLFNYYIFTLFKIFGGIIIILLSTKMITISKTIIKVMMFYVENYMLVGVVASFNIKNIFTLFISVVLVIIIFILENFKKYYIFIKENKYNVIVINKNKEYKLKAFYDTGNNSFTSDGIPIIYLSSKYYNKNYVFKEITKVNTVIGCNDIEVFTTDLFKCKIKGKYHVMKVAISFIDEKNIDKEYDCILNYALMI